MILVYIYTMSAPGKSAICVIFGGLQIEWIDRAVDHDATSAAATVGIIGARFNSGDDGVWLQCPGGD